MHSRTLLAIRFSSALPDLSTTVEEPQHTSVLSLIRRVREQIPAPHNVQRIRLIYAGRVLGPESSLVEALRLQADAGSSKASAKGKAPIKPPGAPDRTYYIHATFSDALAASALEKEKADALAADASLAESAQKDADSPLSKEAGSPSAKQSGHGRRRSRGSGTEHDATASQTPISPATQGPQGFDRLLSAGLSPLEIASLRSQFMAILAHTHTPDNMPNAFELRELEERWLDNDDERVGPSGGIGRADGGEPGQAAGAGGLLGRLGGNVGDEDSSGLDDMLWGNIIGFFWPIGAVVWLAREEGVWTQRRKIAIVTGALVNLAFSIMRAAS